MGLALLAPIGNLLSTAIAKLDGKPQSSRDRQWQLEHDTYTAARQGLMQLETDEQELLNERLNIAAGLEQDNGLRLASAGPIRPITELIDSVRDTRRVDFDGNTNLMQILTEDLKLDDLSEAALNLLGEAAMTMETILEKLGYDSNDASIDTLSIEADALSLRAGDYEFIDSRISDVPISPEVAQLINTIFEKASYDDLIQWKFGAE